MKFWTMHLQFSKIFFSTIVKRKFLLHWTLKTLTKFTTQTRKSKKENPSFLMETILCFPEWSVHELRTTVGAYKESLPREGQESNMLGMSTRHKQMWLYGSFYGHFLFSHFPTIHGFTGSCRYPLWKTCPFSKYFGISFEN
jgi:hypothetical protein